MTLTGSVTDEVTRQLAENAVSGVAGVKSVNNRLGVGDLPPAEPAAANPNNNQNPANESPVQPAQAAPQGANSNNGWGPAGPPPDAVNGQVPPQPAAGTQQTPPPSGTTYGAPLQQGYPQQGSYPNNGYPPNSYPNSAYPPANGQQPARPAYQSSMQRPYVQPSGPVTLPEGTLLTVRLQNYIDSRHLQVGDVFVANAARDVFENGVLALPLGATIEGHVVAVKKPGAFSGDGDIQIELTQLYLSGQPYPLANRCLLDTDSWQGRLQCR